MTLIDQFESVFRSAAKDVFSQKPISLNKLMLISDLEEAEAQRLKLQLHEFLSALTSDDLQWHLEYINEDTSPRTLHDFVESHAPHLICTYRNLGCKGQRNPYGLGQHLEMLTQSTTVPVLVLPHPKGELDLSLLTNTRNVMAVTDHLLKDDRLINWALHFTQKGGALHLSHVEDQITFDRYMNAISKIQFIDTQEARVGLAEKLLQEPQDYIDSVRKNVQQSGRGIEVKAHVGFGHYLAEYSDLLERHEIDLLVMNTKDDDQLAMHGLAYPLAVELCQIPLLML